MSGGPSRIVRIAGAVAEARPMTEASLYELAYVGEAGLLAEVVRIDGELGTLQIYEETTGLSLGEPVRPTGGALTVQLGPGLLGSVLDGIGRPLDLLAAASGDFIRAGTTADTLDAERTWAFTPALRPGAEVGPGDVLGTVEERPDFEHRVLVPPGVSGRVGRLERGEFTVEGAIGELEDGTPVRLAHAWRVREPRPCRERSKVVRPFITGQRVFDFLFPVGEGGSSAVPGGFGTGKTIIEQSLAKFAEADVVVYVGCGERGNEMTEVLTEFPELIDPRTGRPVMDRAVLVVNTSNMPVAAREASIYLGVTIAEYYRDMGYRVALMVDSTSRWAEALREISARLGEMPGEEGYPTYLASRLGVFFERAGRVRALGEPERDGAVTIISAVSPPGGDFSEPVTQASLRVSGALWALDSELAHQRHYPAVDWELSYSLYAERVGDWFAENVADDWVELRRAGLELLQKERELREIAQLVGPEALEDQDRLLLESSATFREVVLRQNAFHPHDGLSPVEKTYQLAAIAIALHRAALEALEAGATVDEIDLEPGRHALAALRVGPPDELEARAAAARAEVEALAGTGGRR